MRNAATDKTVARSLFPTTIPANDDDPRPSAPNGRTPLLDHQTELDLLAAWREHHDRRAAERLVVSYQPLVVRIAGQYRRSRLPMSDLVAEGNVGLMLAIAKFDTNRGVRLATYAMWWIRAAINDFVVSSSSVVKAVTTEHHKRVFFNLGRLKARLSLGESEVLPPDAVTKIANELEVSEADVVRMDRWLSGKDLSLNVALGGDDDGREWQDTLVDPDQDQESELAHREELRKRQELLDDALAGLDDRERQIVTLRFLSDQPARLAEIGARMGITRERVRQIESRAMEKLRTRVLEAAGRRGLDGGAAATAAADRPAFPLTVRGARVSGGMRTPRFAPTRPAPARDPSLS